jgi:hypothetical protein
MEETCTLQRREGEDGQKIETMAGTLVKAPNRQEYLFCFHPGYMTSVWELRSSADQSRREAIPHRNGRGNPIERHVVLS